MYVLTHFLITLTSTNSLVFFFAETGTMGTNLFNARYNNIQFQCMQGLLFLEVGYPFYLPLPLILFLFLFP